MKITIKMSIDAYEIAKKVYLEQLTRKEGKIMGRIFFENALNAAQKHIEYYATLGKGNLTGLQTIINQMR